MAHLCFSWYVEGDTWQSLHHCGGFFRWRLPWNCQKSFPLREKTSCEENLLTSRSKMFFGGKESGMEENRIFCFCSMLLKMVWVFWTSSHWLFRKWCFTSLCFVVVASWRFWRRQTIPRKTMMSSWLSCGKFCRSGMLGGSSQEL